MSHTKWTGYVAPPISTAQQLRRYGSTDRASTRHHDIKGPASFLHLPYELREPIYHEILPANRILAVAKQPSWSEQAWLAIQQASPHVSNEMRDYASKHCDRLLVLKRKSKCTQITQTMTLHGNRIPQAIIDFKRAFSTKPKPFVPLPSPGSLSMSRLWKDDGLRRIYEKHYLAVDEENQSDLSAWPTVNGGHRSKRARIER
ncbi:hypothetical protein LTR27_012263 [Elasticomyces elasticus]|nr:hypothetical protein LTR27_012263 [Elasticomyces elasticus]